MARLLTTKDAHNIINLLVSQMTGTDSESVVDASSFVSAGELVMSYGKENVLNALTLILGRTMIASRPYSMNFVSINAINTGVYSHRLRKISYYSKDALETGYQNTDLFTNFKEDYDNNSNGGQSTASMWEQHPAIPLEMNFAGSSAWQDCITTYVNKLEQAFNSEADFNDFISGIVQEKQNDIEQQKEAFARLTVLNHIAGAVTYENTIGAGAGTGMAYNLTAEFNDEFGTSYTTAQLQTVHLEEFLKFFTAFVNILKRDFRDRDALHHWDVTKTVDSTTYHILRHTPPDRFRGIFSSRFFEKAKSYVFPTIFNDEYLDGGQGYELVNYWQSKEQPMGINFTPAIPDFSGTNNGLQTAGQPVELEYVLGMVYDVDGIMVDYQLDEVYTSPLEARKGYYNTWYTLQRNAISDLTEKCAVLYMADA